MHAIVLSRRPYREFDEMISLYTYDHGRVEALARGNKKIVSKQSPWLEPFSVIECALIPGRGIDHLAKTQSVEYFAAIRADITKSLAAGWAVSLTRSLTPECVPDRQIWFALKSWLEFLAKNNGAPLLLWDSYAMVLMRLLGFVPQLDECVICHKKFKIIAHELLAAQKPVEPGIYFAGGGLICGQCRLKKADIGEEIAILGLQELSALMLLVRGEWRLVTEFDSAADETRRVHDIAYRFVIYHSETPLRNWREFKPT